jgi:CheY-like chemotaxis protein
MQPVSRATSATEEPAHSGGEPPAVAAGSVRPLHILAVGDFRREEFRGPRQSLDGFGVVLEAATIAQAIDRLTPPASSEGDDAAVVDLVVLAQNAPGCFPAVDVERLRRPAPTARFVALAGSWCEGEVRSGHPPPGVIRVYWHQWAARAGQELRQLRNGRASTWCLPQTAGDDEPFLVLADEPLPCGTGRVAVVADEFDMRVWLADALRQAGFQPPSGPHDRLAALVYDASWAVDRACDEIGRLAAAHPGVPIVVLMEFPRQDEVEAVLAAGAAATLSKPLVLHDLLEQVVRVAG